MWCVDASTHTTQSPACAVIPPPKGAFSFQSHHVTWASRDPMATPAAAAAVGRLVEWVESWGALPVFVTVYALALAVYIWSDRRGLWEAVCALWADGLRGERSVSHFDRALVATGPRRSPSTELRKRQLLLEGRLDRVCIVRAPVQRENEQRDTRARKK